MNLCRFPRTLLVVGLIFALGLFLRHGTATVSHSPAESHAFNRMDSGRPPAFNRNGQRGPGAGLRAAYPGDGLNDLPAVQRQVLRRTLDRTPQVIGAADAPGIPAIELITHRIITTESSEAGVATDGGRTALMQLAHTDRQVRSQRNTLPYIIQFNGKIDPDVRAGLLAAGVTIHDYLPQHALLVEACPDTLIQASMLPEVHWIGEYRPAYKLDPLLGFLAAAGGALRDERVVSTTLDSTVDTPIPVTIQTLNAADIDWVAFRMRQIGLEPDEMLAGPRWGRLKARVPAAFLNELAALAPVVWIEEDQPRHLRNDRAVQTNRMNVTTVWNTHGLTGHGQVIGHADTGLDTGDFDNIHPDFAGRIVFAVGLATGRILGRQGRWNDPDGHGTHTAGSILGSGAASGGRYRGVAWEAQLVHQSLIDRLGLLTGIPADLNILFQQAYTNAARIHANSWGASGPGRYTTDSLDCDQHTWDYPDMLLVFAAGNEGMDADADGVIDPLSMGSPATAKNVLSVGASESGRLPGSGGLSNERYGDLWPMDYPVNPISNDFVSASPSGNPPGLAAFSSRGPTDDDRIKPDVVAPGTDIISPRSQDPNAGDAWGAYSNNYYVFMGGTSMATPLAAGAAALVRQFYIERRGMISPPPSAALIKATMINGARTLTPGQYGTGAAREIPPRPRPNIAEGWGEIDLQGSLFPAHPVNLMAIDNQNLSTGETHQYLVEIVTNGPFSVTLAWSDHPPALAAAIKLVNDLDLMLTAPDGTVSYPNGLAGPDRRNNVETIDLEDADPGVYRLEIHAVNVPLGPQPYALVMHGPIEWQNDDILIVADRMLAVDAGEPLAVDVLRQGEAEGIVSVDYATSDGTALGGVDYFPVAGTLIFSNGHTVASFSVNTMERMGPGEDRQFYINLTGTHGDAIIQAPSQTVVTVRHHYGPGNLRFAHTAYTASESDGSIAVAVQRVGGREGTVSVGYRTREGSARAGLDYMPTNGVLTFTDSVTNLYANILGLENNRPFAERVLTVELFDPTDGTRLASPSNATLTIYSDAGQTRNLLDTGFDGGLPSGWLVETAGHPNAVWRFDDPATRGNLTGGLDGFAIADSAYFGPVDMDTSLITPALDLARFDSVTLDFRLDVYLPAPGTATGDVDLSLNGPAGPWQNLASVTDINLRGPYVHTMDISAAAAGKSAVTIRFRYRNSSGIGWLQIDDVLVASRVADGRGDIDGDGLPDWWEIFYFGGPTQAVANAASGGKGMTNWEEYIAGTDPTDPSSRFGIESIMPFGDGTAIGLGSLTDRVYRLWSTTNLWNIDWMSGPDIPGVEGPLTILDDRDFSNRYYRIDVRLDAN